MTKVFFYHNAEDRLLACCQLLRKASAQGKAMMVFCSSQATLDSLDRLLWTFDPLSFVPHCSAASPLAPDTPIVLTSTPEWLSGRSRVLSLDSEILPRFDGIEALIEVVSQAEQDRAQARARFRAYKELGFPIQSIDLSQPKVASPAEK